MTLAGRDYARVYDVSNRHDIHAFLASAIEASGGQILYASSSRKAPIYFGVQGRSGERIGLLVYAFRMTKNVITNRPSDEVRGQIRYGSEDSWLADHPLGQDIAGVDITLMLGVYLGGGVLVGLQPSMYNPLPMGTSFYAKARETDAAAEAGWHVWEKENKPGSRRVEARGPTGLETIVAFTPDRLLKYALFERRAGDLGLDQPLRFNAATASTANEAEDQNSLHALEAEFELSSQEILEIISTRNRLQVAVRGGVAEHHLQRVLLADPAVASVDRLDQDALHDFDVRLVDGRQLRVECKNASPNAYADGAYKVEVQKTRASKNDPTSRFYRVDQFDVVATCLYSPTKHWTFRYRATNDLARHVLYRDHLAPLQRVDERWVPNLAEVV